jgi:hypothetical protein
MRLRRWTTLFSGRHLLAVAATILLGACGGSSTSPSGTPKTDTITGVLSATGSSAESVLVNGTGDMVVQLTSLSPQSTITVGLGVGLPSGSNCGILEYNDSAKVGSLLSLPVSNGIYCWILVDTGNVSGSVNYTVTVTHP